MRIGKYEFGLVKPFGWYGFQKDTKCLSGCTIYMFGPFFFTILANDCISYPEGETDGCIVKVEPVKETPMMGLAKQLELSMYYPDKALARDRKRQRKKVNNGKALPKRKKKRVPRSKNKR